MSAATWDDFTETAPRLDVQAARVIGDAKFFQASRDLGAVEDPAGSTIDLGTLDAELELVMDLGGV